MPSNREAAECLKKDRDPLLAFYDFPAEHWKHLRTSNPIESTFATVRQRTNRSKGCLSNRTALAMVFKLVEGGQKTWRRLDGHNQLPKIIRGVTFGAGYSRRPAWRREAGCAAFDIVLIERLNTTHPDTDPSRCARFGKSETPDGTLLPIGVGARASRPTMARDPLRSA